MSITGSSEFKKARMADTEGAMLSQSAYNAVIGFLVLLGLGLNFAVYFLTRRGDAIWDLLAGSTVSPWVLVVPVLIGGIAGSVITQKAKTPGVRVLGFLLMALVMSFSLTIIMSIYMGESILAALSITAVVTVFMMMLAVAFPSFFLGMGRVLGISLLVCIIAELVGHFAFHAPMDWMNWVVALLFCGFIGFDWARAQAYPKSLNNAIASAADIYLDVINLFIRILEIMGRRRD